MLVISKPDVTALDPCVWGIAFLKGEDDQHTHSAFMAAPPLCAAKG